MKKKNCIFCNNLKDSQIIAEYENFILVFDINPIQYGHMILISKSHYMNIIEMPDTILKELILIEKKIVSKLENNSQIKNVSIIQNNGEIMDFGTHFHIHIVPRYLNDGFWDNHEVDHIKVDIDQMKQLFSNEY